LRQLFWFVFIFLLFGCGTVKPQLEKASVNNSPENNWLDYYPSSSTPRGCVLLVHGLNMNSGALKPIAEFMASQGFFARIIILQGHNPKLPWPSKISEDDWLKELETAYLDLKTKYPALPLVNVSYSMGAPLSLVFLKNHPEAQFEKFIFLAPAITTKCQAVLLRLLTLFDFIPIYLPSLAPEGYRSHNNTSLRAYSAFFSLERQASDVRDSQNILHQKALIFLSPDDELISLPCLNRWIRKNQLQWKVQELNPGSQDLPKHLIVDENSLGKVEWNRLKDSIASFISSD